MTEHNKLDIYKQHNLFLTAVEVGKSEVKVPADSVSGSQAAVSPDGRKGEGALWGFSDKRTDSIHEGSPRKT